MLLGLSRVKLCGQVFGGGLSGGSTCVDLRVGYELFSLDDETALSSEVPHRDWLLVSNRWLAGNPTFDKFVRILRGCVLLMMWAL